MQTLQLDTPQHCTLLDLTARLQEAVRQNGWRDGCLQVFTPHTTAGLTINEGADPDVKRDLLRRLDKLAPQDPDDRHAEGNSDAHLKASLMGCSLMLPVVGGKVRLGTWQAVYFAEFDGPRTRQVHLQFLAQ